MEPRILLGEKPVVVGQTVNARWLGQWYSGTVLTLGPRENLFKVKESISGECFLIEKGQLKPIDRGLPTHQQLEPGAEVAYYDNDINNWISGTILENNAVGMLYISWNKFPGSPVNENWFSLDNVALILASSEDEDGLTSKPSWLDILEEKPRFVANEIFQDGMRVPHHLYSFINKLPSPSQLAETHDNNLIQPRCTSTSMKNHYVTFVPLNDKRKNRLRHKSTPHQANHLYNHLAQQRGKLDHTEVPPVWSYLGQTKGIPPHPSSAFYRRMNQAMYLPPPSTLQRTPKELQSSQMKRAKSDLIPGVVSRSATRQSNPISEPPHGTQRPFNHPSARSLGSVTLPLPQHLKLPRAGLNMSHRPLPEVPASPHSSSGYEVPFPSRQALRTDIHAGLQHPAEMDENPQDSFYSEVESRAPHIESSSPSLVSIEMGGSTLLTCQASGDMPITYEWERNGRKLTNNNERIAFPSPGMLQLYSITSSDAGTYKCTARNKQGTISRVYTLKLSKGSPKKPLSSHHSLESSEEEAEEAEEADTDTVKIAEEEAGNLRQNFMEQTPTYNDYPMDLSHPMPQIPTVIVESVQQQRERKEHARVAKKVEERKTKRNRRKRVSTTLHNDMDSYLGGYGADYGAEPTDSELLALPAMEQPVVESRQARKKPRKGFLSHILGAGNRLTASKSAQVLQEMASSSSHDLELSKSTTALTDEKVREPLLSKQAFDSQEEGDNSSLHSGATDDHREASRAGFGRRQVGFSPIREIIIQPATPENGFDQLTQSSANLSDEDGGDTLRESDSGADEPDKVFRPDAQDVTLLRADVEEMDVVEDDEGGSYVVEPVKKPEKVLPAGSQDSLDAHASHESLLSDETSYVASDREERGKSDLPQETAHYTESVLRLQDAHSAYHEEHFGKKKKSKRPLKRWFRSKSDDSHEKRTMI